MDLQTRLDALETRYERLVRGVWTAGLALAVVGIAGFAANQEPGVIRATEVIIEDPNGVIRARLGGDLPDAVFDDRTINRGSEAVPVLTSALSDPEPLVRAHAAWALGRVGSPEASAALSARSSLESDESVRSEVAAALSP